MSELFGNGKQRVGQETKRSLACLALEPAAESPAGGDVHADPPAQAHKHA